MKTTTMTATAAVASATAMPAAKKTSTATSTPSTTPIKWHHLRTSRVHDRRVYIGIEHTGRYARLASGRDGDGSCVYLTLNDKPFAEDANNAVDATGSIHIPVKYGAAEAVSIDKAAGADLYRLKTATLWQIENELTKRNCRQPTGWFQKSSVITVQKDDLAYLEGDSYWSMEIMGERPAVILAGCAENPGDGWKNRTHALKKRAFGVSRKYVGYVGLTRNTQLQCIKTNIILCGEVVPCFCFLAPDHNDAVTGRIINESLENVIRLDIKKEADERLSVLREYMSHTEETATFESRINTVIDRIQADKSAADKLLGTKEMQELLKKIKKEKKRA